MSQSQTVLLSTRDIAKRYGVPLQRVVRVVDRLELGQRVGRNRVIRSEHLEHVELGLRAAGFLPLRREVGHV
jgi:hypothetical protein